MFCCHNVKPSNAVIIKGGDTLVESSPLFPFNHASLVVKCSFQLKLNFSANQRTHYSSLDSFLMFKTSCRMTKIERDYLDKTIFTSSFKMLAGGEIMTVCSNFMRAWNRHLSFLEFNDNASRGLISRFIIILAVWSAQPQNKFLKVVVRICLNLSSTFNLPYPSQVDEDSNEINDTLVRIHKYMLQYQKNTCKN